MTISEFDQRFSINNENLIIQWIEKKLIPGAIQNTKTKQWFIPECAWPPYTKARARNTNAIYKSIVKGIISRRYVSAIIYNISENEFQTYISQLSKAGIIQVKTQNNIPYYYSTPKSQSFLNNKSKNIPKYLETLLPIIVESTTKGIASAIIQSSFQ